jgi:hypothetical protein
VPTSSKIIQLRELLAERGLATTAKAREHFLSGWSPLDVAAGSGLPKGDIVELHCPRHGGAFAVAQLLESAACTRRFVALIDATDGFDPASVAESHLAHLLWVRCKTATEAIRAADLLLRDGNLPLVLLNLRGAADAARIPSQAWYRLQRIVEHSGVTFLIVTPRPMIPSARVRIALHAAFSLDDIERERSDILTGVHLRPGRVQGTRADESEPQRAEVG